LRVFLLDETDLPELVAPKQDDIFVRGKADLRNEDDGVSGLTGQGVPELLGRVTGILNSRLAGSITVTRERHRIAIGDAIGALEKALKELYSDQPQIELAAESLRQATRALDSLTGRVDVEVLLGEIFSSFCIGK
jgi:tRNA modification GTPase